MSIRPMRNSVPGAYRSRGASRLRGSEMTGPGRPGDGLGPWSIGGVRSTLGAMAGRRAAGGPCHRRGVASTAMATIDDVRRIAADLPRSYEALIRDRVKFKVGQWVYIAFSRDEREMGFAFPKDEREALC